DSKLHRLFILYVFAFINLLFSRPLAMVHTVYAAHYTMYTDILNRNIFKITFLHRLHKYFVVVLLLLCIKKNWIKS
ncbi:hypothetical protein L9F63_026213, partial [Diploptera punctata]